MPGLSRDLRGGLRPTRIVPSAVDLKLKGAFVVGLRIRMAFDHDFRIRIDAARPIVFERLLRIEHLARWFCGWARIEPRVGGSFKFGGETCIVPPEGRGWVTTIEEGETLRRFAFRWPIQQVPTRVAYDLADDEGDATVVAARHEGVPVAETTAGSVQDMWRVCLGNLKSIAEGRGDSVRPDHSPPGSGAFALTTLIEASTSRVFVALTDQGQVDRWSTGGLPGGRSRIEPAPGGEYALGLGEPPLRVSAIKADREITLHGPEPGGPELRMLLEAKASGTAIYLTSRGHPMGRERDLTRARGRWADRFVCLKNLIEGHGPGFLNDYRDQVRQV